MNLLNIVLDIYFFVVVVLFFPFFSVKLFLSLLTVLLLPNGGTLWSCELLLLLCYCIVIIISLLSYIWQLKRHVVHYEPFLCPIE